MWISAFSVYVCVFGWVAAEAALCAGLLPLLLSWDRSRGDQQVGWAAPTACIRREKTQCSCAVCTQQWLSCRKVACVLSSDGGNLQTCICWCWYAFSFLIRASWKSWKDSVPFSCGLCRWQWTGFSQLSHLFLHGMHFLFKTCFPKWRIVTCAFCVLIPSSMCLSNQTSPPFQFSAFQNGS